MYHRHHHHYHYCHLFTDFMLNDLYRMHTAVGKIWDLLSQLLEVSLMSLFFEFGQAGFVRSFYRRSLWLKSVILWLKALCYVLFFFSSSNAPEKRRGWKDAHIMVGVTIHAVMMKMLAYDVQDQTRQENVLPSVEMAITSRTEKGNVPHVPQAVSPAKIHRTLARAATLRNFFEKQVCLKSDDILATLNAIIVLWFLLT